MRYLALAMLILAGCAQPAPTYPELYSPVTHGLPDDVVLADLRDPEYRLHRTTFRMTENPGHGVVPGPSAPVEMYATLVETTDGRGNAQFLAMRYASPQAAANASASLTSCGDDPRSGAVLLDGDVVLTVTAQHLTAEQQAGLVDPIMAATDPTVICLQTPYDGPFPEAYVPAVPEGYHLLGRQDLGFQAFQSAIDWTGNPGYAFPPEDPDAPDGPRPIDIYLTIVVDDMGVIETWAYRYAGPDVSEDVLFGFPGCADGTALLHDQDVLVSVQARNATAEVFNVVVDDLATKSDAVEACRSTAGLK